MSSTDATIVLAVPDPMPPLADGTVPARMADALMIHESPGRRGLWCTTKGLGGFGLPELQSHHVPLLLAEPWAYLLTGVALRLVEMWTDALRSRPAFVELPALIELTENDVARAYGRPVPGGGRSTTFQLESEPRVRGDSFLNVEPPGRAGGSGGAYLTTVCANFFGSLPHAPPEFNCEECAREAKRSARTPASQPRPRSRSRRRDSTRQDRRPR
jgi:hypothetical protein